MFRVQARLERICKGSRAVYRHQLENLRLQGVVGPVNINKDLALSHVVDNEPSVPWREFYVSETFVYRAVRLVRLFKRPGIRQRTMKAFQDLLRNRGLPGVMRRMISVPPEIPRQLCKAAVHQISEPLRITNRERWSWIMEQTVLVSGRKCTFQDRWNAIDACKSIESSSVVPNKKECLQGARKDDRFWKLERVRTGVELRDALLKSLTKWKSTLGRVEVGSPNRAASRAVRCVKVPPVDPLFVKYVAGMDDDLQDRVLVPDDKGKSMAWWVSRQQYCQSVFNLFYDDKKNWTQSALNESQTVQACRSLHVQVAEGLKMKVSSKNAWKSGCLPYSYGTIKAKCFDQSENAQGRVCTKVGHVCQRRIISWIRHPARSFFQSAGRALAVALLREGVGWETKSLLTAPDDIRNKWNRIKKSRGHTRVSPWCLECGVAMTEHTVVISDAAQFFETVSALDVVSSMQELERRIRRRGFRCVMVKRTGKLSGFLGRAESCVKSGFRCWSLKRMRCGVELALAQGSITLGDQLWKQQRGVPIGGMVSKCSCSVTLGMSEQIWSETHGKQFKGHLATTRYVDDLVVLSPDTCRDCIT